MTEPPAPNADPRDRRRKQRTSRRRGSQTPKPVLTREAWGQLLDENHELARRALLEAVEAVAITNAYCPRCRGRVEVRGPDIRARTDALKTLVELAGRRPKQADVDANAGTRVERRVVLPGGRTLEGGRPGTPPDPTP